MKQKDIALIIVVVFVSAFVSLFVSNMLFGSDSHDQKAEEVLPITAEFKQPDSRFFNKDSFDPTQTITIEQNTNADPFSGAAQ